MRALPITAAELAAKLGCSLEGSPDLIIRGAAPIEEAGQEHITFLSNPKYRRYLNECKAGAIVIAPEELTPPGMVRILSPRPYIHFTKTLEIIYPDRLRDLSEGIHPSASVDSAAVLGSGVRIGAFVRIAAGAKVGDNTSVNSGAFIGRDAVVGQDCTLGVNVVVQSEVVIGNRVVIGDGSVIGFDGFGYAPDEGNYLKIPQVGTVIISDDVEIGANCCIDRATVGATRIGTGSKLDNLIQVAHGVQIGEHSVIAAQSGISGSSRIGSHVMMGGQVGMVGHIEIGDGMMIGAQSGVSKSFDIKGIVTGTPAKPLMEERRMEASLQRLPDLFKRVRELEKKLDELKKIS